MTTTSSNSTRQVPLQPADSFDLIRLIAHSQSDCRKAVAELVQNALDAAARHVIVKRHRSRGALALSVWDDGSGVFPELSRPEALEYVATHIGHSFKRNLSAVERQQQMMLGKYGIGILGFWCIGQELEMRTQVEGSEVWSLRLVRDQPVAEVRRVGRHRELLDEPTWTEVVIRGVHASGLRQLAGRRMGEYLGTELRGQLLARDLRLQVVDAVTRETAYRDFLVVPRRYTGMPLNSISSIAVPPYADARLELYLADGSETTVGRVALTCGGTVVCESLAADDTSGLDAQLWSGGLLEGVVEFPDLVVVPGTRRGFVAGPEATALFHSLAQSEPAVRDAVEQSLAQRDAAEQEALTREIRRAFRPVAANLPQYGRFTLGSHSAVASGEASASPLPPSGASTSQHALPASDSEIVDPGEAPPIARDLFPPGAPSRVMVTPRKVRMLPGATCALRASVVDAFGRELDGDYDCAWQLQRGNGQLVSRNLRAQFTAGSELEAVAVTVTLEVDGQQYSSEAEIEVSARLQRAALEQAIPEPERVHDAAGRWRSRVIEGRWQFNAAHPNYLAVASSPRQRLRYLVHLFAKEIVLRSYGDPKDAALLERMVEMLTHIDVK